MGENKRPDSKHTFEAGSMYLAAAEEVSPQVDPLYWWRAYESQLPKWAIACSLVNPLQKEYFSLFFKSTSIILCITPSSDLARIYARRTRARRARGRSAYIPARSRRRGVISDL